MATTVVIPNPMPVTNAIIYRGGSTGTVGLTPVSFVPAADRYGRITVWVNTVAAQSVVIGGALAIALTTTPTSYDVPSGATVTITAGINAAAYIYLEFGNI